MSIPAYRKSKRLHPYFKEKSATTKKFKGLSSYLSPGMVGTMYFVVMRAITVVIMIGLNTVKVRTIPVPHKNKMNSCATNMKVYSVYCA